MSLYELSPLEFTSEFDFVPDLREPTTDRPNERGVYSRYPSYEDPNYPRRICAPSAERTGCLGSFVRSPYDLNPLRRRIDDITMVCPRPPRPCTPSFSQTVVEKHVREDPYARYVESFSSPYYWALFLLVLIIIFVLPSVVTGIIVASVMRSSRDRSI